MTTVPGLDASYWQADVDWHDVRASGRHFVFLKATEGLSYTDPTFAMNWQRAGDAGLLRGAYGFFHPDQDARQQARRFVATLKAVKGEGELPCSLDLEVTDGVSNKKILDGARIWLSEVEQALGRRPLVYAGVSFLETNFVDRGEPPKWTQDYALWLGWFPEKYLPGMPPLMPRGWDKWTFWQFSGKGIVDGIGTEVDLDLFNGTIDDLYKFAAIEPPEPNPPTHTVATGDTLESIAEKYRITLDALIVANPGLLRVGQVLNIPPEPPDAPAPNGGNSAKIYTVKLGDTLSAIAAKYSTTVQAIAAHNGISNPDLLTVGQELEIV